MGLDEPFILELPDEILDICFNLVIESELRCYGRSITRYRSALALSLTCRRFNSIVLPLLYHDPTVPSLVFPDRLTNFSTISFVPPTLAARRFCRTMQENPTLGEYCKSFQLSIFYDDIIDNDISVHPFSLARNLSLCLTNLRSLAVRNGFKFAETWRLVDLLLQSSPHIEDLQFGSKQSMAVFMGHVYRHLNVPNGCSLFIESLKFQGNMRGDDVTPPAIRPSTEKAAFKNLALKNYRASPFDLQEFVLWFNALESFWFYGLHYDRTSLWKLNTFNAILYPHRSTLKRVRIDALEPGYMKFSGLVDRQFLDLSAFPSLEILHMPVNSLACTPETACTKLLAPHLHTLVLDFGTHLTYTHDWKSFVDDHAIWLKALGRLAHAAKPTFKKFRIRFDPDPTLLDAEAYDLKYPWDLIHEVRDAIKQYGIDLSHNEPCLPKFEFLRVLDMHKENRAKGRARVEQFT